MGTAFVTSKAGDRWSIGNSGFEMEIEAPRGGIPVVRHLRLRPLTGVDWAAPEAPFGPVVEAGGGTRQLAAGTLRFTAARTAADGSELVLAYACDDGLRAELHLAPSALHPVWRSWLVLANASDTPIEDITRFDAMNLAVSCGAAEPQAAYVLGWMEGPRADAPGGHSIPWKYGGWIPKFLYGEGYPLPPPPPGGWSSPAYRLKQERLVRLPLRSGKRSTYDNHPWVTVLDPERAGGFFAGFAWSGTWRMDLEHRSGARTVTAFASSDGCTHLLAPKATLESPAAFTGLFAGDWDDGFNACRLHVADEIVPKIRPAWPTTLHVYYFHNTPELRTDEYMRKEIDAAAALGFESTYVESPWWSESPLDAPPKDFSLGLGDFADNRGKFPCGLRAMSDYVHAKGMNFGMWFEVERVDIRTCNRLRNPWKPEWVLHQKGYPYRSWCQYAFMLCLGVKAAADWVLENILWSVKEYNLDYIMFDSNEWAVCDDPTHDHGPGDGEWAQIHGFLHVIRELRKAHPDIMVLNSSGGSQRADFGIARYSTYVHPHDTQAPSARERRYLHGTGCMYPSGYQAQALGNYAAAPTEGVPAPWLAYAYNGLGPIMVDPARFEWRMLSRFLGYFALGQEANALQPGHAQVLRRGLAFYKRIRTTLNARRYVLLPPRVLVDPACEEADNWEAYEHVSRTGDQVLLHFYRCLSTEEECTVKLRGLDPEARYRVESWRGVTPRTVTGKSLMERGFTCALPTTRCADIVILTRV